MALREIHDQAIWDNFVRVQPHAPFHQSWAWGVFQESQGHVVRRFFYGDGPIMAGQFIFYKKRWTGYWFLPRGPIFSSKAANDRRAHLHDFLEAVLKEVWKPKPLFFRIEPTVPLSEAEGLMPRIMRRNHSMSPAATVLIDLKKNQETLLAAMHEKTRYHIRLAERAGVSVRVGISDEDFEAFWRLLSETGERNKFMPHNKAYLFAMWKALKERGMATLRLAEYQGMVLSANMEMAHGDTVTYLHGSSSAEHREVRAPFLLHWEAIKDAQKRGFAWYDFWGANPANKSSYYYKPTWEGISRFKEAWGGEHVDLVGTWDLPMNRFFYRLAFPEGAWRG
ncbi:MAG: peptidoglycan bridge formation glycyltransferase FemA/FemB family protein [bacterium]|nr:peptidoglycan bridge formation glycyltransferase FemA/FemB family protein [bacterium]